MEGLVGVRAKTTQSVVGGGIDRDGKRGSLIRACGKITFEPRLE